LSLNLHSSYGVEYYSKCINYKYEEFASNVKEVFVGMLVTQTRQNHVH